MRRAARRLAVAVVLTVAVALTGCGGTAGVGPSDPATTQASSRPAGTDQTDQIDLTVFGAASLRTVLEDLRAAYEAAVPGTTLTISTDSSAALATQIEEGAPADIFLSADLAQPERLVAGGLVDGAVVPFAGNLLTIIVPAGEPGPVTAPVDLAGPGVRVIAAGDEVPITRYASQLIENLAALDGYPADFEARYAANVASKEDNVAGILTKIELGEGDAGIVYATDAARSQDVRSIAVPAEANVPAIYGAVVLASSPNLAAARAFLGWLTGPDGQAMLQGSGFTPPST